MYVCMYVYDVCMYVCIVKAIEYEMKTSEPAKVTGDCTAAKVLIDTVECMYVCVYQYVCMGM